MAGTKLADVFRLYIKPSMDGALITRKRGVRTPRSDRVQDRMKVFTEAMSGPSGIVVQCRGKKWKEFVSCLRTKSREKGLGTGEAKKEEYRRKYWRIK